ncbi:MAG TPA: hypothetical protein VKT26_02360 [Acetobacteraceae bacterium]|nr:hypothetical protein [Acetobacteraceae bacterium]
MVSPACRDADRLERGIAFSAVPDGAVLLCAAAEGGVWGVVAEVPDGGLAEGAAVCDQAGTATSIVVISRGAARVSSVAFIAGFSVVGLR